MVDEDVCKLSGEKLPWVTENPFMLISSSDGESWSLGCMFIWPKVACCMFIWPKVSNGMLKPWSSV